MRPSCAPSCSSPSPALRLLARGRASFAQYGGGRRRRRQSPDQQQQQDDAKKKKRDEECGDLNAPPAGKLRNAGPCPYVKVLYDAARYVEFKDDKEASAGGRLHRRDREPRLGLRLQGRPSRSRCRRGCCSSSAAGRRPTADRKTYRYWVAVTDRNHAVLDKQYFDLPVTFPAGPGPGRR